MNRGITAEQVRRVLLVLAADEIRIAREARDATPPPLNVRKLHDHAGSHAFCRSLAREAANDVRLAHVERDVDAHVRAPRPTRRP
jgi:hypothetical protein